MRMNLVIALLLASGLILWRPALAESPETAFPPTGVTNQPRTVVFEGFYNPH